MRIISEQNNFLFPRKILSPAFLHEPLETSSAAENVVNTLLCFLPVNISAAVSTRKIFAIWCVILSHETNIVFAVCLVKHKNTFICTTFFEVVPALILLNLPSLPQVLKGRVLFPVLIGSCFHCWSIHPGVYHLVQLLNAACGA